MAEHARVVTFDFDEAALRTMLKETEGAERPLKGVAAKRITVLADRSAEKVIGAVWFGSKWYSSETLRKESLGRRVRRRCLMMLVPLAALAAACGGDSVSSSSSAPSSNTPSATAGTSAAIGTVESSATSTVIDGDAALTQTVDAKFDPAFTLRIPADWTAVLRDRWAFQAYFGNEDFEITFDHTHQAQESVNQAIGRLMEAEGLAPGPVSRVVVGGREGKSFVAESQSAVQFVDSGFHTNDASKLEVMAIPVPDGTTITIFLTAGGDPMHGLDVLAPLARRIFDTVEWRSG